MPDLWVRTCERLSTRLSAEMFETWIEPVSFGGLDAAELVLRVPNRFYAEWLGTHYAPAILESAAAELLSVGEPSITPVRVRFEVDESLRDKLVPRDRVPPPAPPSLIASSAPREEIPGQRLPSQPPISRAELNPKYTFDSFVVGASNQLAHAASLAVATSPGRRYNPLFLCGGVGLGKTHLVNAIGHKVLETNPNARIIYVSAERFMNDFISAIKNNQMEQFRALYREGCDVLLMDDIQFIARRESTMEEFFHTFNALHHMDKQIVVTSDVYPEHLEGMEARVVSRFQSGLVADIQAPDIDTRVAILEKKAESEGIVLDKTVANFLAQCVKSNVRELEGTLIRLSMQAELMGKKMDFELARTALRAVLPKTEQATSVEDIQKAVCDYFSLRMMDMKSQRRHRSVAFPRMLAMYLCRHHLGTSFPELGERFGGKDHTTVLSACRKINGLLEAEDERVKQPLAAIERRLGF